MKGAEVVLKFHSGSLSKALLALFPEIGLDETRFRINRRMCHSPVILFIAFLIISNSTTHNLISANFWQNSKNRRSFFEDFASRSTFDPLVVRNWYRVGYNDITACKVLLIPFSSYLFKYLSATILFGFCNVINF